MSSWTDNPIDNELHDPPAHLNDMARTEWSRVVPLLSEAGLADTLDRAAIAAYCVAWARWCECEQAITDSGLLIEDEGRASVSPLLTVADKALDQVTKLSEQIGLTTSGRTRLTGRKVGGSINRALGLVGP